MIVVVDYLRTDKHSGVLIYRRKFPKDLVAFIPGQSPTGRGRIELKASLRSSNINDPQARARYAELEQQFEAIVSKARREATQSFDTLAGPIIRYLVDQYVHDHLETDEAMRWRRKQRPATYDSRGDPEIVYDECREMLEGYDSEGLIAYWKEWACQYADALGFLLNPADPELPALCQGLGEAACSVWLALDRRIDHASVETPPQPQPPTTPSVSRKQTKGISLLDLFDRYAAMPSRHPKTMAQWRPYIAHLAQFAGEDDAQAITHDQLVAWRNHLRDKQTYRGQSLSAKTINGSYLGAASALFAWAKGDGIITRNPMSEVTKVKLPAKPRTRSKSFTTEEALTILRASQAPSVSREGQDLRNAKRWCPWLMAYSGARVNEITQLRKEDLFEQDGVKVFRITPEAGTVKTKAYRLVPLHSHLVDQGFWEFVQRRPEGPLFFDPSKRRSDHAINRQANRLGSKLAEWVRTLGVEGVKPNHAWRHLFISQATRFMIDPRATRAITGHASSDAHGEYDHVTEYVDVLSRELEKMPRFLEIG